MKKSLMLILIGVLVLIPMVVNAAFPDVASTHWAAGFINELTDKGVINGYNDGTFKPENTLTKGEFLKLIVTASMPHLDYSLAPKDFEHWAAGYVKVAENYSALEKGVINSSNINEPITRIEVITILSLCDINMRENAQVSADMMNFSDINDLSMREFILLSHAVGNGIINGYNDGTFKPYNNLTRAEASKILSVYMNK